jgi:hypothetical protein
MHILSRARVSIAVPQGVSARIHPHWAPPSPKTNSCKETTSNSTSQN